LPNVCSAYSFNPIYGQGMSVALSEARALDAVVLRRFFEVASLLAPPTAMMSPAIAWRVLLGRLGAPQATPASSEPAARPVAWTWTGPLCRPRAGEETPLLRG
jgi:hypothetical protein